MDDMGTLTDDPDGREREEEVSEGAVMMDKGTAGPKRRRHITLSLHEGRCGSPP
ncbi:MAG: hypothetical protein MZV70_59175 [Desulfobacterales bacterium]|nr:hypothetical protein [Desulfobacterales bacterium]